MYSQPRTTKNSGNGGASRAEVAILKNLIRYVGSFDKKECQSRVSTTEIKNFAKRLGVNLGKVPKKVDPILFSSYVYELASQKGLGVGLVACINVISDRYQVLTAEVLKDTSKSFLYLDMPLVFSHIKLGTDKNDLVTIGFSVDNYAFVDPIKAKSDADVFLQQLGEIYRSGEHPLFSKLARYITKHNIDNNKYVEVCSYNRIKFEEIQHAKDHIFADIMAGEQDLSKPHKVKYLLKPGSVFYKLLDTARTEIERQLIGSTLAEYSASLVGILTELTIHKNKNDYVSGALAFLDFIGHQYLRSSRGENSPSENISYSSASSLFFDKLRSIGRYNLDERGLLTLFDGTPEQVVNNAITILSKMAEIDFYNDAERESLVKSITDR